MSELGPESFHSESVLPLTNHAPVSLCRDSRAMLKFFQGSGGESQFWILPNNSSPAKVSQPFRQQCYCQEIADVSTCPWHLSFGLAPSQTRKLAIRQRDVKRTEGILDTLSGHFVVLEWKHIQYTADYKLSAFTHPRQR